MKILIGGDFFIEDEYAQSSLLSNEIINLCKGVDYRIVNLEGPLTEGVKKIIKTGPHLKAKEQTIIPYLKQMDIDLVTLSNNHILDYGEIGLKDTVKSLKKNGISYTGVGDNLSKANRPFSIVKGEMNIAIVNFSENEWSSASNRSAGANPMDIVDNIMQLRKAKEDHNYVICIVHGGHEYYNLPSPRMQNQYRFYAENGADIVIGHHSHCISGHEIHGDVPIYYSIGNMLFTRESSYPDWYEGVLLEVVFSSDRLTVKEHPVKQDRGNFRLNLLDDFNKNAFLQRMNDYSLIIKDQELLLESWKNYIKAQTNNYLGLLSPRSFIRNKYLRGVLKKMGITFNNKQGNSLLLNMLRCEAHRDLSIEVLESYLNDESDK